MPCSKTFPFFNTYIKSAFLIVESLWAIIIEVTFFPEILSKAFCTSFSDLLSKADVASSRINNIFGFANIALAIAILCFCPPDNLLPLIPPT